MTFPGLNYSRPVLCNATDVAAYAKATFDGFNAASDAAPYRIKRRIAGTVFEFSSDVLQQLALASYALAGTETSDAPDARLLITGTDELNALIPPVPFWNDHSYNDARMCQKFAETDLRLHHFREKDFWQFYDKGSARGVQRMATEYSHPDWDAGSPLRNLIRWYFTNENQSFVHAGTLGDNGRGVMMAGPGGSGKSGTVLAGLLAGMQSVGDDYILGRLTNDGVQTAPIFTSLKNDPKGLQRLGVETEGFGYINWQGKHQFTFQDLVQRDPTPKMDIMALCVPYVTGDARTTITPMPRPAAYLALAQTGFEQMPGDSRLGLNFCSEVIRRLPTFRMSLGTEPAEIIDTLREFIATQQEQVA